MKNILKKTTLTVIACFIGTFLFAQQQKPLNSAEIEKKAAAKTALLKQKLNLSIEQEKTIGELTRNIAFKSAEGIQPQAELDEYYNAEVAKILDSSQLQQFKAQKLDENAAKKDPQGIHAKGKAASEK